MKEYAERYKVELLENVIPFWEKYSIDHIEGGYFTCLNRNGDVFDTDKFIWLQARQVYTFSALYNDVSPKDAWLNVAEHGAAFLLKHGRDEAGNWYFSLDRKGNPLVQPYNIFSDCFAAMAFASLYKSTGNEIYAETAKTTFENILKRKDNPKGKYSKIYPGVRQLVNFSLPMILCNISLEMEHLVEKSFVEDLKDKVIEEVMSFFYNPESGLIHENVLANGKFSDSFDGRLLIPGHSIEAMWFVMDLAKNRDDQALIQRSLDIALHTLEKGWDHKYGGMFYFLDSKGYPPQQLEWDQKLWWVHLETLVCLAKGYQYTGSEAAKSWFLQLQDYTWSHFKDKEFGEWFGYLKRDGEVLLPLKGGKWKGCFHMPRAMYQVWQSLENIETVSTSTIQNRKSL